MRDWSVKPRLSFNELVKIVNKIQSEFPFPDYMTCRVPKYLAIINVVAKELPPGSKILDVGCGACDVTALLARLGYNLTCVDDLRSSWHLLGRNRDRIVSFCRKNKIDIIIQKIEETDIRERFDAVIMIDVIEHLLSPRIVLNKVISLLKPNGLLLILTPNHAALAKRIKLLLGKPVYPDVQFIFFNVGEYRGHIKEYTISELLFIMKSLRITNIRVKTLNILTKELYCEESGQKKFLLRIYDVVSSILPSWRDTIIVYGRKSENTRLIEDIEAFKKLKQYIFYLTKYNFENEDDESIIFKLRKLQG